MKMKLMNLAPQLKCEYNVYLLNFTLKIKKINWAFEVFKIFYLKTWGSKKLKPMQCCISVYMTTLNVDVPTRL